MTTMTKLSEAIERYQKVLDNPPDLSELPVAERMYHFGRYDMLKSIIQSLRKLESEEECIIPSL